MNLFGANIAYFQGDGAILAIGQPTYGIRHCATITLGSFFETVSKFLNAFTLKRIIAALVGAHEAFFFA